MFEEQYSVKVDLNYFSSNEELLAKLQAGASGYDLIVPSGYIVRALKMLQLIQPLGKLDWPELNYLNGQAKAPKYDPQHEYTIPYAWGTSGLAVNRSKVKSKVDSWAWLFDHPELKGQITVLDDAPAVVGIALKYLGYSYNETNASALAQVKQLLTKQKKWLKAYVPEVQQVLTSGEIAIAHSYSGDTLQVRRLHSNIEYIFPKEGGEIFMDNLAIPKGANSPELAKKFMQYTLLKKVAAIQLQHLFFSAVVDIQNNLADRSLLTNRAVFPTPTVLQKYEVLEDNPTRLELIEKLWLDLKSS